MPPPGATRGRLGLAADSCPNFTPGPSPAWERSHQDQRGRQGWSLASLRAFEAVGPSSACGGFTLPPLHWLRAPLSFLLQTPSSHMHEG